MVNFSADDKNELLQRFPPLELSYDKNLFTFLEDAVATNNHIYALVPMGPKVFVWYTYWRENNICLVLPLNDRGNIILNEMQALTTCFSSQLALGTVLYGTYFSANYFACSNIYYFRGSPVAYKPFKEKLALLYQICHEHTKQVAYTKSFLVVGLPIIKTSFKDAAELCKSNELGYKVHDAYKVYGIQIYNVDKVHSLGILPLKKLTLVNNDRFLPALLTQVKPQPQHYKSTTTQIFDVVAASEADIYYLYKVDQPSHLEQQQPLEPLLAIVPTYAASVKMNQLFRNIKENKCLDLLEESDDEAEFENIEEDKFVDKTKRIRMSCVYLKQFNKWQPVAVVN